MLKRISFLLLFALVLFAQNSGSGSLGVFTASGVGTAVTYNVILHKHTVSAVVTGSPSGCTLKLEGSLDGTNFFDLSGSQTCTSSVMFHVTDKPVYWVRANLATLSGGSSPTVTVRYAGVQ